MSNEVEERWVSSFVSEQTIDWFISNYKVSQVCGTFTLLGNVRVFGECFRCVKFSIDFFARYPTTKS